VGAVLALAGAGIAVLVQVVDRRAIKRATADVRRWRQALDELATSSS
jgi:hypothetical protein